VAYLIFLVSFVLISRKAIESFEYNKRNLGMNLWPLLIGLNFVFLIILLLFFLRIVIPHNLSGSYCFLFEMETIKLIILTNYCNLVYAHHIGA
jgi:hypothetical protein